MRIEISDLRKIRKKYRTKKIVFAGGVFDLLHPGHVEYFQTIKQLGDILVIAVSTNKRVQERKGHTRPIISEEDRAEIVDALQCVDYTLIAPERDEVGMVPTMFILKTLQPDIFTSGDPKWEEFRKDIEALSIQLKIVPRSREYSTSAIIQNIIKNQK